MLINYRCLNIRCASLLRKGAFVVQSSASASHKFDSTLILFHRRDFAGLGLTQSRHLRTRPPPSSDNKNGGKSDGKSADDHPNEEHNKTDDDKTKNSENMEEFSKMFEENFRKRLEEMSKQQGVKIDIRQFDVKKAARNILMMWFVIGSLVAIGITYLVVGRRPRKTEYDRYFPHAPHVSADEFLAKYLPTGEVQRIVLFPARSLVLAILHPNAVIEGEVTRDQAVVINCNVTKLPDQIRRVEEHLGIPSKDSLHMELVTDIGPVNILMFMTAMGIVGFLCSGYLRLAQKAIGKWRAGGGKNPFGGGGASGQQQ